MVKDKEALFTKAYFIMLDIEELLLEDNESRYYRFSDGFGACTEMGYNCEAMNIRAVKWSFLGAIFKCCPRDKDCRNYILEKAIEVRQDQYPEYMSLPSAMDHKLPKFLKEITLRIKHEANIP